MRVAVSAKGLSRVEARGSGNDPPVCLLKLPAAPGDRWDFRPPGAGLRGSCAVREWDRFAVPAGTYLTLRVEAEYTHGGPAERTFATLVGLELRPRKLREATALWQALTEDRGVDGRAALWNHPDLMPTADDIENPERFIKGEAHFDLSELEEGDE